MKFAKSRLCGALLILLSAALLLAGIFSSTAEREGTPFHGVYAGAIAEKQALTDAGAALTAARDALDRADKRAADALSKSEACAADAKAALETEQSAGYDAETDVGALGQAIADARSAGMDVSAISEAYSPVYNTALLESLSATLTDVKRAEKAVEDGAAALQSAMDAVRGLVPGAEFAEIPAAAEAQLAEESSQSGATGLLIRAENYVLRGQAAGANASALRQSGEEILAAAQAALDGHPVTFRSKLATFAHARALDLMVAGGILLLVALMLIFAPAKLAKRWKSRLFRKGFFFAATVALLAAALHYADGEMWALMRQGVFDTLYMTIPATIFAYLLGLPLGILLVITAPGNIRPNATLNNAVGTVVNFLRSIPFIILLVMLFDVTRFVMGAAIGTRAVIFPLFVSAFPYVARIVEGSLNEVDRGVIEAAESMGSTTWQIIRKVLVPEAMPSLINGAAICMTTILGYTAMAGSAGGDGLGKIAITYGLNYREYDIMYVSSLLLVALVQIIQIAGNLLTRALDHRAN